MALIRSNLAGGGINFDDISAVYVENGFNANATHTVSIGDILIIAYQPSSLTLETFESGLTGADVIIDYRYTNQYNHSIMTAVVRATSTTLTCPSDPNTGYPVIIKLTTV